MTSRLCLAYFIVASVSLSCSQKESSHEIAHFKAAINYSNEAARLANESGPFEIVDDKTMAEIVNLREKALIEAQQVSVHSLNNRLAGFGDHFANEYVKGNEAYIEGYRMDDPVEFHRGQLLLDDWSEWYGENADRIRRRMDWWVFIACCLTALGGRIMFTYHSLAGQLHLPIGSLFEPWGLMMGLGGILGTAALIASIILNPWWSLILVMCIAEWSRRPVVLALRVKAQTTGFALGMAGATLLMWQILSR